jgi:hypothetical protein
MSPILPTVARQSSDTDIGALSVTICAIREFEIAGVRAAFLNAIQAAMERSLELAAGRILGHRTSRHGCHVPRLLAAELAPAVAGHERVLGSGLQ